jgi:hypothetical protein
MAIAIGTDFATIPICNKRKYLVIIKKQLHLIKISCQTDIIFFNTGAYVSDSRLLTTEKVDIPIVDVLNLNTFTAYNEY